MYINDIYWHSLRNINGLLKKFTSWQNPKAICYTGRWHEWRRENNNYRQIRILFQKQKLKVLLAAGEGAAQEQLEYGGMKHDIEVFSSSSSNDPSFVSFQ